METQQLPTLRFNVTEAAQILRISRSQLCRRIYEGAIKACKDGTRVFITITELQRYVDALDGAEKHVQQEPAERPTCSGRIARRPK